MHELRESKFPFVSRIEFFRSKLSNLSAHVSGISGQAALMSQQFHVGCHRAPAAAAQPPVGVREVVYCFIFLGGIPHRNSKGSVNSFR